MSKGMAQRQRIGPQIRHLRQLRGLTLDDLAGAAGLSASHLSRLERSQTLPSFTVLANIAQVLEVSIDEFVQLEHDLQELDEQLAWQADLLSLDDNAHQEILGLSIDTRRQLNRAIELLSNGTISEIRVQEKVSTPFTENGEYIEAINSIQRLIDSDGHNGVGLSRALVQVAEIPGPRIGVLTDAGMLATTPNIDYAAMYRGLFPELPLDPPVARKWSQWASVAGNDFPFDWPIKLVIREDLLDRIRERFNACGGVDGEQVAAEIARYWHRMLDSDADLHIALTSRDLPRVNVLTSNDAAALFEKTHPADGDSALPVSLWVSGSQLVQPVLDSIQQVWDDAPDDEKDPSTVRAWLERYFG